MPSRRKPHNTHQKSEVNQNPKEILLQLQQAGDSSRFSSDYLHPLFAAPYPQGALSEILIDHRMKGIFERR